MITVKVDSSNARVYLANILAQARRPAGILQTSGRAVAKLLKKWYLQRDREQPNRLGGPRTHFWLEVSRSVQAPVVAGDGTSVTVTISHPIIAQKVFGGTIRAKRASLLTIPQTPEAYGRTAATFERETGLKLIFLKQNDHAILASRAQGQGLTVQYVLVPSVHQEPDPNALPPEQQMEQEALTAADKALERQLQQPGQAPTV
jgi:hypothetical protein